MNADDYATVLFGQMARHVPAWMYIQDQGAGAISFVGGSRTPQALHPLRYGNERTHQFIVGEIIVRPHVIVATDTLRGQGLAGLVMTGHDITDMLCDGELLYEMREGLSQTL